MILFYFVFILFWLFIFYLFIFFFYHDNFWKAQPIRTKFSHMTFAWNISAKFENGHHRSHITPANRGLLSPLEIYIPPISTNPNQILTHEFWLEYLSWVRKWSSQVKCNPSNMGFLPPWKFIALNKADSHTPNRGLLPSEKSNTSNFDEIETICISH